MGEASFDFLLGSGGGPLTAREVSSQENCNVCHVTLQGHEGRYRSLTMCLLCHTKGAEDKNDPSLAGGTPGVSIDSAVLFHKLHNGSHLPSVNGIGVDANGFLDYSIPARPYQVVGEGGVVRDYSTVGSPIWPNRTIHMPRDFGYSALGAMAQMQDDVVRTGLVGCIVCHLDPDRNGPVVAPAQGELAYTEPRRAACESCHDDVDWERDYQVNTGLMPPQPDDSSCQECHARFFITNLEVQNAHRHPLRDPAFNPRLILDLLGVAEAGNHDADGTLDPGEKVSVTFSVRDGRGNDIPPQFLSSLRALVSGPTENMHLILDEELPLGLLVGPQPFTMNLPARKRMEFVGDSSTGLETFGTRFTPHVESASTIVTVRAGTAGGASMLLGAAASLQNFVDVVDPFGFERNDAIVLEDGVAGVEEYLLVQFVEGNRLWFSSPNSPKFPAGLAFAHPAGASVLEVVLTPKASGIDYTLDAQLGQIVELIEFGAGNAVLVDYTTDFVLPSVFPAPHNGSPIIGEAQGLWTGKPLVDGTYRVGVTGYAELVQTGTNSLEDDVYPIASDPATLDYLVGSAQVAEPYELISSGENCNSCHQDLTFHDGKYRGFDNCILCHGAAGAEDLPRYVAANAPETPGVTVNFRTLIHQIHRGRELSAPSFTVVGAGSASYPDNFSLNSYGDFLFPAQPGASTQCRKCHGETNDAWIVPAGRDHPSSQLIPVLTWRGVCLACHDSNAAAAHVEVETSPTGNESCAVCHGPGDDLSVETVHKPRQPLLFGR